MRTYGYTCQHYIIIIFHATLPSRSIIFSSLFFMRSSAASHEERKRQPLQRSEATKGSYRRQNR
jgi:hypothetical protein